MNEDINRLGFTAWAHDRIANFLEDHGPILALGEGNVSIEGKNFSIVATYDATSVNITLRGYTGEGWETCDVVIKHRKP